VYADTIVHDDVSPINVPHRAGINPGLYLSHVPALPKLDLRVEAVSTDPPSITPGTQGRFFYWEGVYRDAYLNKTNLMGNWIGRDGKGYQAWSTYWLSPKNSLQFAYRRANVSSDFIPGGTTQNDFSIQGDYWMAHDLELKAIIQYERWSIPLLDPNRKADVTTSVEFTFWPHSSVRHR
jgi:hypothetical protein